MLLLKNKLEILIPDATYHIYNRANGNEKLFLSNDNYKYFLEKYISYITPIADTFCYCLMPNHFHFLIRIKSEKELMVFFKGNNKYLEGFQNLQGIELVDSLEKLISNQFSNFFNSYAKAFNKCHNRKGSLFMHTYKRKRIQDKKYLYKLVHYIHFNPIEAGLCANINEWQYSSYNSIISEKATYIKREEIIEWFADVENFIYAHKLQPLSLEID